MKIDLIEDEAIKDRMWKQTEVNEQTVATMWAIK